MLVQTQPHCGATARRGLCFPFRPRATRSDAAVAAIETCLANPPGGLRNRGDSLLRWCSRRRGRRGRGRWRGCWDWQRRLGPRRCCSRRSFHLGWRLRRLCRSAANALGRAGRARCVSRRSWRRPSRRGCRLGPLGRCLGCAGVTSWEGPLLACGGLPPHYELLKAKLRWAGTAARSVVRLRTHTHACATRPPAKLRTSAAQLARLSTGRPAPRAPPSHLAPRTCSRSFCLRSSAVSATKG